MKATPGFVNDLAAVPRARHATPDLRCGELAFLFERHTVQTDTRSFGSALLWTSTQLLLVSSAFRNPISTAAHVLDVVMKAYAITVVATLAGSFGAFFHRRSGEREAQERAAQD